MAPYGPPLAPLWTSRTTLKSMASLSLFLSLWTPYGHPMDPLWNNPNDPNDPNDPNGSVCVACESETHVMATHC